MPKQSEPPYFVLVCTDSEVREQLQVCANSEFRTVQDPVLGGTAVYDRETLVLRMEPFGHGWFVWLHRKYYRHPFGPPSDGNALPGVP